MLSIKNIIILDLSIIVIDVTDIDDIVSDLFN